MLDHQTLLHALSDGDFHSGEELGAKFSVSRAAIWKYIQQLEQFGVQVQSIRGKGYRLATPLQLLSPLKIKSGLSEEALPLLKNLSVELTVDSTNSQALAAINHIAGDDLSGCAFFAEYQQGGRGRRGRKWQSPFACNIYMSVIWRFQRGVTALEGLSLAVGVSLVESLESLGYKGLELKWPNDIYWQGRKLGGVLVEIAGDINGVCDVVVGVGLNVLMSRVVQKQDIDADWVDLLEIAGHQERSLKIAPDDRNALCGSLLSGLLPLFSSYEESGFAFYRDRWLSRCAFKEQAVNLLTAKGVVSGVLVDLGLDGSIGIQTAEGVNYYNGGEISLRLAHDH